MTVKHVLHCSSMVMLHLTIAAWLLLQNGEHGDDWRYGYMVWLCSMKYGVGSGSMVVSFGSMARVMSIVLKISSLTYHCSVYMYSLSVCSLCQIIVSLLALFL